MNFDIFKKFLLIITVLSASLFLSGNALAEDMVIVVNKNVNIKADTVSKSDIKRIYLGQTDSIFGQRVKPIGLKNDPEFVSNILGMSSDELKQYWIKESLKGGGRPPRAMSSTHSLIIYIKKKSGTIGYLNKDIAKKSGLKILNIK